MDHQPAAIYYHQIQEPELEHEPPVQKAANSLFSGITLAVLFVLLAVWSIVGAFFWIPLLLRAMIRYSLSLVQSVFVGQRPDGAARILRDALSFYRRGFVVAVETVTKEKIDGEKKEDPQTGNRLLLELLWAVPVWYVIFFSMGWIQVSPLDMWNWFVEIRWSEMLGRLIDWVRA
jgi:hypothetical protein